MCYFVQVHWHVAYVLVADVVGYLEPCVLSPELAAILGESRVSMLQNAHYCQAVRHTVVQADFNAVLWNKWLESQLLGN